MEQQQNFQVDDGIRISDIFRLLLSKIKTLILVVLIGATLGGLFAIWQTYDVDYYGTQVEFYVNPNKDESTPSSPTEENESSQYSVYGAYGQHVMDNIVRLLSSDAFLEEMMLKGQPLPEKGKWGSETLDSLIDAANAVQGTDATALAQKQELTERALVEWSKTRTYQSLISRYRSMLHFDYLQGSSSSSNASNNLARSFIYVQISVLNDKDFAQQVLEEIKIYVPQYVERNMPVPQGYSGTHCQRITRTDDVRLINPGYTTDEAVKYALLAGLIAFVVACIAIIVIDRSDKRVRDIEVLSRTFQVPLLGVVPTIEELDEDAHAKKTKNREVK